jgi:FkbM family methyltransferase
MLALKSRLRGTVFYPPINALASLQYKLWRWQHLARRNRRMRQFYSQFIEPGDLAFDVGASLGSRTRIFLGLGARVVAVEPQKECARCLFIYFHANPNFHLVNKALGAAEGKGEMFISNFSVTSTLARDWVQADKPGGFWQPVTWPTTRTVSVTTLDALIQEFGKPALVKVDTECSEFEIMRGLSSPLPLISLEFLPDYLEPILKSISYLMRFAPIELNYTLEENFTWMLKEWVTPDEMISILETYRASKKVLSGEVYIRTMDARSPIDN